MSVPLLTDERIAAYLSGALNPQERAKIEVQMDQDPRWLAVLAALVQGEREGKDVEQDTLYASSTTADKLSKAQAERLHRGDRLGRYQVEHLLGRGGVGTVYAAWDPDLSRRIALKLLQTTSPDEQHRLVKEARALARVSNHNVITVYDFGTWRGRVFVAMELLEGVTLRRWLTEGPRTWRNVVAVFTDIGRGLNAAHLAGVVHRDVKPGNVMITSTGRVVVLDFGLALHDGHGPQPDQNGFGTPAYMAPEQRRGQPTDHRSDQFSFAVSFYEALYGARPFSKQDLSDPASAFGPLDDSTPPGSKVPRRIHRAIVRALSESAADRFPSMRAFLYAIAPPARSPRTWILGSLGGLAGLGAGAGAVFLANSPERPCSAFDQHIAETYGKTQREAISSAFTATELSYAQASFDATAGTLDRYAERWAQSATDACLATERNEQSEQLLDLRMHCLDRARSSLDSMVELFSSVQAQEVQGATQLVATLPDLGVCENVEALPKLAMLPENSKQADEADLLLPVLDRIHAASIANRYAEAAELLDEHEQALRSATYPLIRTLYAAALARMHNDRSEYSEALRLYRDAHLLALEYGLDRSASRSATGLAAAHRGLAQYERALQWNQTAVALARAAGLPRLEAPALASSAESHAELGQLDEAVQASAAALALVEDDPTFPPRALAELHTNLSRQLFKRDGGNAGVEQLEEAKRLVQQLDGDAPVVAALESELSRRATLRADYPVAHAHAEEARRIAKLVYGSGSPRYAAALLNVAIPLKEQGRLKEALAYNQEALSYVGRDERFDELSASILLNTANIQLSLQQDVGAARSAAEGWQRVQRAKLEKADVGGLLLLVRSHIARLGGDLTTARSLAQRGLALALETEGEHSYKTADARMFLARVAVDEGNYAEARRLGELARSYNTEIPADRARISFVLARALYEASDATEADRRKALSYARSARDALRESPSYPRDLEEVQQWLEARDRGVAPG